MGRPSRVLPIILVLHFILSMASPSLSCVIPCESEINLRLYLHQIAAGSGTNQVAIVASNQPAGFGTTAVNDWTVIDGPNPGTATIVARTKGMHVQADVGGPGWFNYFSMVFEDARRRGSSFEVMGMNRAQEGEMAIIGGTGEFAMARGTIKYRALANPPPGQSIKELNIHAFYVKPAGTIAGPTIQ
ncbi:hypothetical protein CFC21_004759 [Triticum aestivum]|uniref:Dirigent protein n=3 Tax=Triticum TaxID=4564 RepID=A0A9R0QJ51_TRITD|nr:dirigent protein 15-like [Triticum aestivum]XP_044361631.1 dirigent protein 15-like [Triticum aestivum]KAF6987081.1 hypothetical protein CFC21_004759 [Triticum aestivum]VAH12172.1 unnamed protein product [Triticum turgidum subsp. durum]